MAKFQIHYYGISCLLLTFYFFHIIDGSKSTLPHLNPSFTCENGNKIQMSQRCDGIFDCNDGSDESFPCAVLFYSVDNQRSSEQAVIRGIHLEDDDSFRTSVTRDCDKEWKLLAAEGPHLFLECANETSKNILQIYRNGTILRQFSIHGNLKGLAIDYVTSNMYIIENSYIKMCDATATMCTMLKNKFINNPLSLTFDSKNGYLFWVEEPRESVESFIVRCNRDGSSAIAIRPHAPHHLLFLTLNVPKQRLYWLNTTTGDGLNKSSSSIVSSEFDGSDQQLVRTIQSSNVHSFAAHEGILFWPDQRTDDLFQSNVYARLPPVKYATKYGKSHIGENVIIYDPSSAKLQIPNPCDGTVCSHLCTFESANETSCYCPGTNGYFTRRKNTTSNGYFCEDATLLATFGNNLYVIGLLDSDTAPAIRKTALPAPLSGDGGNSITHMAYDSIKGNIIFTDTRKQSIFQWQPMKEDAKEIIRSSAINSITAIEFDSYGRNVYWINGTDYTIRIISLNTKSTTVLFRGNSTYVPVQLSLFSWQGTMFVLFSRTNVSGAGNNSVTLESMSMDGRLSTRILMYEDKESKIADYQLFNIRTYTLSSHIVCLLHRSNEEITYFSMDYGDLMNHEQHKFFITGKKSKLHSFTSMKNIPLWTEENSIIHRGKILNEEHVTSIQTISLGLSKNENKTLRILGVVSPIPHRYTKCSMNNGGCSHFCVPSQDNLIANLVCLCGDCDEFATTEHEYTVPDFNRTEISGGASDVGGGRTRDVEDFSEGTSVNNKVANTKQTASASRAEKSSTAFTNTEAAVDTPGSGFFKFFSVGLVATIFGVAIGFLWGMNSYKKRGILTMSTMPSNMELINVDEEP